MKSSKNVILVDFLSEVDVEKLVDHDLEVGMNLGGCGESSKTTELDAAGSISVADGISERAQDGVIAACLTPYQKSISIAQDDLAIYEAEQEFVGATIRKIILLPPF